MQLLPKKNIAFWGTPALVIPFLDTLEKYGYTPVVIITGEDKPQGRGLTITPPLPKVWGQSRNIPILQPKKLDDTFLKELETYNIDLSIVVAYGKIIKENIINLPTHGTINVHYSLLPKYRGATPVEQALLHGDTVTGVSIQQMVYDLDAGDILSSQEYTIPPTMRKKELFTELNKIATGLLPHMLEDIFNSTIYPKIQDNEKATRCSKIKKEDGEITLGINHEQNWNKFRAYEGWPSIYTFGIKNDKRIRIIIKDAEYKDGIFIPTRVVPEGGKEVNFSQIKETVLLK